jgi:cytidylate kinase
MTWFMLDQNVDLDDPEAIAAYAKQAQILPSTNPDAPGISVGPVDVSEPIRGDKVTSGVSRVSAVPEVRTLLVDLQREIAANAVTGIVAEGRDIGPVVLPDATIKIFLTADESARAARRAAENGEDVQATQQQLASRDKADSTRKASPLVQADDAIVVDTTLMSLEQVIEHIINLVRGA